MHEIDLIHVLYPRMFALADLNVVTLAVKSPLCFGRARLCRPRASDFSVLRVGRASVGRAAAGPPPAGDVITTGRPPGGAGPPQKPPAGWQLLQGTSAVCQRVGHPFKGEFLPAA